MGNRNKITLKEHFEKLLDQKDKYYERIFLEKDNAINIALQAAEKASLKTEQAQRDYNATHNDLLRKMDEQYKVMIPRAEFEEYKRGAEKALALEKERADKGEGRAGGIKSFLGWIVAGASIIYQIYNATKKQ